MRPRSRLQGTSLWQRRRKIIGHSVEEKLKEKTQQAENISSILACCERSPRPMAEQLRNIAKVLVLLEKRSVD